MARMTAARAAVEILKREGVTHASGVPGAAINPFYAELRAAGGIGHTLARHVEGASHMAEGCTRTAPGNIGVCIGTSGPAGTDMITGLHSATGDSVPILCVTGQAPTSVLHKGDFQAVDIASITSPPSASRRSPARSRRTSTTRATGSTADRRVPSAGPSRPRPASPGPIPGRRWSGSPATTTSSS